MPSSKKSRKKKKKKQNFSRKLQALKSSIEKAKSKLNLVEKEIDALLGRPDGPPPHYGPRCPHGGPGGGG